ncbi:MAG: NADH-quinone oxidoreductase subunit NuoB [Candidatus Nanoarchaeia archaeon]|nr:NADH-quinone oxidoreductase subunit NuoB [Candidatus Nanoarchaeia archaeon]
MIHKSPWVSFIDLGGCNGCTLEIIEAITPKHDLERFGIKIVGNPKHADILVVAGTINTKSVERLKTLISQMSKPYYVIAMGSCAISGGISRLSYNSKGPLDKIIKVDMHVPGCPPKPEALIHGILKLLGGIK